MDDRQKAGNTDRERINVKENYEVEYWSAKFQVTPEQLRQAVKSAGTSASEVEKLLKKLK